MFDMDGIFSNIIFLIPIALIINRIVRRARAKNAPPPKKPPQPYIPVHFEDDKEDDDLGYFKNRAATVEAPQRTPAPAPPRRGRSQKNVAVPFTQKPEFSAGAQPTPVVSRTVTPVAQPRRGFSFDLNHLTPLKQAVVMSEILGQPKGMS